MTTEKVVFALPKLGRVRLIVDDGWLQQLDLQVRDLETEPSLIPLSFKKIINQLRQYLAGQRQEWQLPLSIKHLGGTDFQKQVWRAMMTIPYGQTRSYAWLARQIGRPQTYRAVANACGQNPVPIIIPCHRVIKSDGSLGGYSSGLEVKKILLRLENKILDTISLL